MDKYIELRDYVNDEQLLEFALSHVASLEDGQTPHQVADNIIITYIIRKFQEEGRGGDSFNDDDIMNEYNELLTSHILSTLVDKGLVETSFEDGDIKYKLSGALDDQDFKVD